MIHPFFHEVGLARQPSCIRLFNNMLFLFIIHYSSYLCRYI